MKVCINGPDHLTNIADTPIYGKHLLRPLKIVSITGSPMILKLGIQHERIKLYKAYINGETALILTYITARLNLVSCAFEWEKLFKCN